ncbi:MAG: T9SS type A sorting domain-containing protein, partial [Flavobacteriales bacterium]|nr:T9SS type A sorting domain-containing protein [Flavobacteriales bacterium]
GSGNTKLPVGDNGVYAPVNLEHTGDATAKYSNTAPGSGSNGTDVDAVSNVEFWELTGNAVVTIPWNEDSDITSLVNNNGGSLSSVSIVGLSGGVWDLISASSSYTVTGDLLEGNVTSDPNNPVDLSTYGQYTFGIDHQVVLSLNDLFLTTGISLLSNPVKSEEENVRFVTSGDIVDLNVSIYDINGRLMKHFDKVDLYLGQGNLPKSNLKSGLYFVKFEHEGKQGVKKIIIE